jgi:hypothetical protein
MKSEQTLSEKEEGKERVSTGLEDVAHVEVPPLDRSIAVY